MPELLQGGVDVKTMCVLLESRGRARRDPAIPFGLILTSPPTNAAPLQRFSFHFPVTPVGGSSRAGVMVAFAVGLAYGGAFCAGIRSWTIIVRKPFEPTAEASSACSPLPRRRHCYACGLSAHPFAPAIDVAFALHLIRLPAPDPLRFHPDPNNNTTG